MAICIRVRVSSKKKTMPGTDIYFILSIKRVLDSMVAYFCHNLSDNYVDLSDVYVDLSLIHLLENKS